MTKRLSPLLFLLLAGFSVLHAQQSADQAVTRPDRIVIAEPGTCNEGDTEYNTVQHVSKRCGPGGNVWYPVVAVAATQANVGQVYQVGINGLPALGAATGGLTAATFASPPSSPKLDQAFLFVDAISSGTCGGGGTAAAVCYWTGSAFASTSGSSTGLGDPGSNGLVYRSGAGTSTPANATQVSGANFCQDAGSTGAYACSLSPAIASYVTGTLYWFKANTASPGSSSINLNAVGALTIKKMIGGIATNLGTNDIAAGQWVAVVYDGTNAQMVSQLGTAVDLGSIQTLLNKTVDGVTPATMAFVDLTSSAQTQLNAKAAATAATTVNGQSCVLGSTCTVPLQTNGSGDTSQAGLNLITSTTNTIGLTVTPSNPSANQVKDEITGITTPAGGGTGEAGTFTGIRKANTLSPDTQAVAADFPTLNQATTNNAGTATALAALPTGCAAGNAAQGIAVSGNATPCIPVPQKFFGTAAPGSVAGNLPGDTFSDTTNHNDYWCNAVSGTGAPACTSVTAGGWTLLNGGGGGSTSVTIAGTANQVTAAGACSSSSTVTCTLSLPALIAVPGGMGYVIPNDTVTGTTLNKFATINSAGKAILATTGTATNETPAWVCIAGCGTAGSATLLALGMGTAQADSSGVTAGDFIMPSIVNTGQAMDMGSTYPPNVYIAGIAQTSAAANATFTLISQGYATGTTGLGSGPCGTPPVSGGGPYTVAPAFTATTNCAAFPISGATTVTPSGLSSSGAYYYVVTNVTPTAAPITYAGTTAVGLCQPDGTSANSISVISLVYVGTTLYPISCQSATAAGIAAGLLKMSQGTLGPDKGVAADLNAGLLLDTSPGATPSYNLTTGAGTGTSSATGCGGGPCTVLDVTTTTNMAVGSITLGTIGKLYMMVFRSGTTAYTVSLPTNIIPTTIGSSIQVLPNTATGFLCEVTSSGCLINGALFTTSGFSLFTGVTAPTSGQCTALSSTQYYVWLDTTTGLLSMCNNANARSRYVPDLTANTVFGNATGSTAPGTALPTTGTGNVVEATTPTLASPSLGAGSSPITETWTVGVGGVTANTIVQKDASNPAKIVAASTGLYGIAMSTVAAAGTVEVARFGTVSCTTDSSGSTANDKVLIGTGTVIDCKDAGTASSAAITIGTGILGTFRNTVTGGSAALVELSPDHFGTEISTTSSGATQKFFGTAAPGSVAGNLPGDTFSDTTNHNDYWCNAVSGTAAPACTSVTTGGWTLLNGGGGGGGGTGGGTFNYADNALTITAGTYFAPIGGGGVPSTTESAVSVKANSATTVTNLQVSASADPGAGQTIVVTLRDAGADKAVTCTITGGSGAVCQDLTHSFSVAQNDLIDWKIVTTGTIAGTPSLNITASNGTSGVGVTSVTASNGAASNGGTTPNITAIQTINSQSSTYATVNATDCGNIVQTTGTSSFVVTLTTSSTPTGCPVTIANTSTAIMQATPASGNIQYATANLTYFAIPPGDMATFVFGGTNWVARDWSGNHILCDSGYDASNIADLVSSDASGGTHYFGQTTSTQANGTLTNLSGLNCALPANLIGANTVIDIDMNAWVQISASAPDSVITWKLGGTNYILSNVDSAVPFSGGALAAQSIKFLVSVMGTAAPGSAVVVDAFCFMTSSLNGKSCANTTMPQTNQYATNGALTLAPYIEYNAATAANGFWGKRAVYRLARQ